MICDQCRTAADLNRVEYHEQCIGVGCACQHRPKKTNRVDGRVGRIAMLAGLQSPQED